MDSLEVLGLLNKGDNTSENSVLESATYFWYMKDPKKDYWSLKSQK